MKDRLSGYRDAMDRSVFKDEKFTSRNKKEVFTEIKKSRKKSGDWFPRTLSAAFGIIFLLVGGYFLLEVTGKPIDQADTPVPAEPVSNGTGTTLSPNGEDNEDEEIPADDEEEALESPYKEIKDYFASYELPEEGRMEGSKFTNAVDYDNGYTFSEETKAMVAREHRDDGPEKPTEGQEIGVIMGMIIDAAAIQDPENRTVTNASDQMFHPLSRLEEIKEMNDFEPLEEWLIETESILKKVETSETEEDRKVFYAEGYERLQKMNSLIMGR